MEEQLALIQMLDEARTHMRDVVKKADQNQRIYPTWTMKQILAHITGWDDAALASLQAHSQGEVPETPAERGIDDYNAQTVAERENLEYEHIVREWEGVRELLKQAILNLPEEKFKQPFYLPWARLGTVSQLVHIFAEHEKEHAEEINGLITQGG
jgi:hypothetical protein